jgi:hypothetical protein
VCRDEHQKHEEESADSSTGRITLKFSGRALPRDARRAHNGAPAVAATPCHGPLQLLVAAPRHVPDLSPSKRKKRSVNCRNNGGQR